MASTAFFGGYERALAVINCGHGEWRLAYDFSIALVYGARGSIIK